MLLTEWVHRLDGLWRLNKFAAAILVLCCHSEGVGRALHQVLQRHAALLRCGADGDPLSGSCVFLLYDKVSDSNAAVVFWVFPGQIGGVAPDV